MKIFRGLLPVLTIFATIGFAAEDASPPAQQPGSERQRQLRQLLAQDCAVCHGKSLEGDLGPALTARSLAGKSEEYLVQTITEGHEETAMPPWWWTLDENDARWLARYIRGGTAATK